MTVLPQQGLVRMETIAQWHCVLAKVNMSLYGCIVRLNEAFALKACIHRNLIANVNSRCSTLWQAQAQYSVIITTNGQGHSSKFCGTLRA